MKEINIWETPFSKFFKFTDDINDLIEIIKNGNSFNVVDKYIPGNEIMTPIESKASENNVILNYIDDNHQVAISNNSFASSHIVGTAFFKKNKNIIIDEIKKLIINNENQTIYITSEIFSEELFDHIINNPNKPNGNFYYFKNVVLTKEQIKKLQDNFITAYNSDIAGYKKISDEAVIKNYNIKKLKELKDLDLEYNISDRDLENLKYISDDITISIFGLSNRLELNQTIEAKDNENEYYQGVNKIIKRLNELGKTNLVNVISLNRSEFAKALLNNDSNNKVNLIITNDYYNYSYNAYKEEEKKLDKIVSSIKNSDMSPFEKYLSVYDIVKKFKPYKENEENSDESRFIRYILDNEYMVCVGYSNLLITLLDKIGIKALEYSTDVDFSYNREDTLKDEPVHYEGHARVILNLDDDKYNIHGIYIADPTWDNNMKNDTYNYAVNTHDSMQKSRNLFRMDRSDWFLDVHNFEEFCKKVNDLFKRDYNEEIKACYNNNPINKTYETICNSIMNIFLNIDKKGFYKLNDIYQKALKNKNEKTYNEFLTEAGHLIVSRVNKNISDKTLISAIIESKKYNDVNDMSELKELKTQILKEKKERDKEKFPYDIKDEQWIFKGHKK